MSTAITTTIDAAHRLIAAFNGIDLSDDRGVEDAPSKLLWVAAAVALAILAIGFITVVLNRANEGIPDPVVPAG